MFDCRIAITSREYSHSFILRLMTISFSFPSAVSPFDARARSVRLEPPGLADWLDLLSG